MTSPLRTRGKGFLLWRCLQVLLLCMAGSANAAATCGHDWPLWRDFRTHFVQESGRVLDASVKEQHSSSESQSYGMFFALVANDRPAFDLLWKWSVDNLGNGDLTRQLPAWRWGLADDGTWGVLDPNSASDADLWYVYALLEAGRLWRAPEYTRQAEALLALVEAQELADLPGLGPMLLPGRNGFSQPEEQTWQLNPSYMPVPVLRRLHQASPGGWWNRIADNTVTMLEIVSPHGFAPDWISYQASSRPAGFLAKQERDGVGSYDAIRVYTWAGFTSPDDPLYPRLMSAVDGMVEASRSQGLPPEIVDAVRGTTKGTGPYGFSAALLPYFKAKGQGVLLAQQKARVEQSLGITPGQPGVQGRQPNYYDYVLSLFGMGWLEGQFRFRPDGTLITAWEKACPGTSR